MFLLFSSLIFSVPVIANSYVRVPAVSASGFVRDFEGSNELDACAYELEIREGAITLRLTAKPEAELTLEITEDFDLPLREGVVLSLRPGFDASYEEGRLRIFFRRETGLREEELSLQLVVDPSLQSIISGEGRFWTKDGFSERTKKEVARLDCQF